MIEELRTLAERLLDHGRHLGGDPMHDPINEAEAHAGSITALSAAEKLEVAKDALGKIAGVRTVVFDGSEPFNNVEIARQALAELEPKP